jgi:hypothetical protein
MNSSYDDYNPTSHYITSEIARRCVLGNVIGGKLRKIDAIKAYRLATGKGLRVSKHAIDAAWGVVQQEIRDQKGGLLDELVRNAQALASFVRHNNTLLGISSDTILSDLEDTLASIHQWAQ